MIGKFNQAFAFEPLLGNPITCADGASGNLGATMDLTSKTLVTPPGPLAEYPQIRTHPLFCSKKPFGNTNCGPEATLVTGVPVELSRRYQLISIESTSPVELVPLH